MLDLIKFQWIPREFGHIWLCSIELSFLSCKSEIFGCVFMWSWKYWKIFGYVFLWSWKAKNFRQRTIRLSLLENKGQGLVLTRCVRKINFLAGDFMPRSCATLKSSAARPLFVFSHSHLSKHNWRNIPVARHNQILKSRNVEEGERVASERPLISFR